MHYFLHHPDFKVPFTHTPTHEQCIKADSRLRKNLTEKEIDKMIEDTFPASDPPSTY